MAELLKKVRPEDLNKEMLWEMALEGIVYVDYSKRVISKEKIADNVRAYVARIKTLVAPKFRESINDIWTDIFMDDELISLLMPTTRAKFKDFNKYNVLRVICVLHNNGVYDYCNDMQAFSVLESTNKNNTYRRFLGDGIKSNYHRLKIRHIVEKYKV